MRGPRDGPWTERVCRGALPLLAASTVWAQGPDPVVTGYRVSLDLPPTGDTITATARVAFTRSAASESLALDLVGLAVDRVRWTADSTRASTDSRAWSRVLFSYDGRTLRIPLPASAQASNEVEVTYHGAPRDGLIVGVDVHGRRAVFADNWPDRARDWLPSEDWPAAKATVAFEVHAPSGWRVVANGSLAAGGGWVEHRPIPPYTMVLGAGRFTVSEHRPVVDGRDTIPIEVWAYPEDSVFADSGPFRRATEMVEVLQRLVGPFPYEKLAHVESATRFGGMENASAIFYDEGAWAGARLPEAVVRHETAHQWFGDAVTERDWHDLWLSEGFATYFDLIIGAALHGDSVLDAGMRVNAERYFRSSVVSRPIVDTAQHDLLRLLNANNYEKGAWVLAMLRTVVGDSAFWAGIRTYYRTFRDATASSADFQAVMESAAGQSLDWFFGQWLRQPGYPMLACRWRVEGGRTGVAVQLHETQPSAWGLFRLPAVVLEFQSRTGERVRRSVALEGRDTADTFELPFLPAAVALDPDHLLLLRAEVGGP